MTCLQFFIDHADNKERCKELQKLPIEKLIGWELESASEFSPGCVLDEEIVLRQIFSPVHYDSEKNEFKAEAFSDVADKGASVNRIAHTSFEAVEIAATKRVEQFNLSEIKKIDRSVWGLVQLNCSDIRGITTTIDTDGTPVRGFVLYDTANHNDISHADVCQVLSKRGQARSVRVSLLELANKFLKQNLS